MNAEQKYIANLAIDRWCKDSTARQIVRYVMECELWGQDTINPTNTYIAGKYGWTINTVETAIKLAKKSQFITTTGARKTRRFELNVGFLKGKMAEIVAQKPLKNTSFDDVLPPYLPPQLPPNLPPLVPPVEPPLANSEYGLPTTPKDENEGDSNKSMNKNNNLGAYKPRGYDVVRVFKGEEYEVEERPKRPAKYPHFKEVFSWFPDPQKSWEAQKSVIEREYGEYLFARGEKAVRGILAFCKKYGDMEFFPAWHSPSKLEKNWQAIQDFAKRNGL